MLLVLALFQAKEFGHFGVTSALFGYNHNKEGLITMRANRNTNTRGKGELADNFLRLC